MSFCFGESCQRKLSSQQTPHGQMEKLKRNELTSHSQLCKIVFVLSQAVSEESPTIINSEPCPSGDGFRFFISTVALYYIFHWYVNESFVCISSRLCGDDSQCTSREQEGSLVLWGLVWAISTELARGCKTIAEDSIGFKVSLCSWILPYPILTAGSLWFSGLYKLRCLCLGHMPHAILLLLPSQVNHTHTLTHICNPPPQFA